MSAGSWRDQVPSQAETEQRATDDREARRERVLDLMVGAFVVLALALLGWAVHRMGGGRS